MVNEPKVPSIVKTMAEMKPIRTLSEFERARGGATRSWVRSLAIAALSPWRSPMRSNNWIRFPYYHHVFDDERTGFARQIEYFKSVGDIINLNDAVLLIKGKVPIDGRYFCFTFDDGFKNCIENALPILVENDAIAAFFVATDYIGLDPIEDCDKLLDFYPDRRRLMAFMNWEDCRALTNAGMIIGSHTMSHVPLSSLNKVQAQEEMTKSKARIEEELGQSCKHFCAPFGVPHRDFDHDVHPKMADDIGYESFITTERGANHAGSTVFSIRRDHMMANAPLHEMKYFMSKY